MRTNFSKRIEDFDTLSDWADIEYRRESGTLEPVPDGHDTLRDYYGALYRIYSKKEVSEQDLKVIRRLALDIMMLHSDFVKNIEEQEGCAE